MRPNALSSALLLPVLLHLAACSGSTTPSEDAALNDAAASLEANSAETNAAVIVDEGEGTGNEDDSREPAR